MLQKLGVWEKDKKCRDMINSGATKRSNTIRDENIKSTIM